MILTILERLSLPWTSLGHLLSLSSFVAARLELRLRSIEDEWDFDYFYEMAAQALKTRDLGQCVRICERGLERSREIGNKPWTQRFDVLHSDAKEAQLKLKLNAAIKKAEKEELVYKYMRAVNFYKEANKILGEAEQTFSV